MSDHRNTDDDGGISRTINCIDVLIDKPGDTTVRPSRPSLRANAERLKRRIVELNPPKTPENEPKNTQ